MIEPKFLARKGKKSERKSKHATKHAIKKPPAASNRSGKGQYRIISEILLFAIGIMIVGYVIVNFNDLQEAAKGITVNDQLENVADIVSVAIVKTANVENATIRLTIPDKVSGSIYRISIKDADGGKLIINTLDGLATVERQLFNINYDNTDSSNNIINNSEVISSAQFIEIVKNEKITLRRTSLG